MNKFMSRITVKDRPPHGDGKQSSHKVTDAIEWALLGVVFAVVLYLVFSHNGFIDASEVQPYPY
jgi:hypothetical protein